MLRLLYEIILTQIRFFYWVLWISVCTMQVKSNLNKPKRCTAWSVQFTVQSAQFLGGFYQKLKLLQPVGG